MTEEERQKYREEIKRLSEQQEEIDKTKNKSNATERNKEMVKEKNGEVFMKGCLIVSAVIVALGILAFVGCSALFITAAKQVADEQQAEIEQAKVAPISDITWEEIDRIYNSDSDFTELQKNEHWKNYKGKKVKWSGKVSHISETFGTLSLQVKLNPSTFTSDVLVRLKESERQDAINLSEGDPVMFVGILDDWGTILPVTLDHGEIVE